MFLLRNKARAREHVLDTMRMCMSRTHQLNADEAEIQSRYDDNNAMAIITIIRMAIDDVFIHIVDSVNVLTLCVYVCVCVTDKDILRCNSGDIMHDELLV